MSDRPATARPDAPRVAYVVSHTHWDREWYLTFHQFRVHLVETMKLVLDELDRGGPFRHFLLDGQTVVLEDFLEVAPDERERLAARVADGSVSVGPWYVLPDEFLVSAESTVRNLLIGRAVGSAVGPVQSVGYMPDSFGHIAQMPQILRKAGIDSFVYTRGNGDELEETGAEYMWRAPDGSEVLAVNQCGGYGNAAALGHSELWHAHTRRDVHADLAVEKVRSVFERARECSNVDTVLLMNGSDHLPPQKELGPILEALARAFPGTAFQHAGLAAYIEAVRSERPELRPFEGELLGGRYYHILSGVWSARIPIKQANDEAQSALADVLEPLASYAHFSLGREYPQGFLDYAWKLLLKNHPHDSICGCSIDEVHRQMGSRFEGVIETADRLVRNTLEAAAPMFAPEESGDRDTTICVTNTLPFERDALVDRLVVIVPPAPKLDGMVLLDESGTPVPFEIVDETYVERFWGIDYRTNTRPERQRALFESYLANFGRRMRRRRGDPGLTDCFLRIRFLARDLPPVGHAVYRLVEGAAGRRSTGSIDSPAEGPTPRPDPHVAGGPAPDRVSVSPDGVLENASVRVTLMPNGTLDLLDKSTGRSFHGLNVLEDSEDVGDEYDHSPCENPSTIDSLASDGELSADGQGGIAGALEARFTLRLPASIDDERKRRSKQTVECPVTVRVALTSGSPVVDVATRFHNAARDHRLRAVFPTPISTDTLVSDGHFYLNHRPIDTPERQDWVQPPPDTRPQQEFSLVEDERGGLAVLNRGLPEVAARRGAGGAAVELTLLRSVGWLSRDDFPTRRCQNAGPTLRTPDAQCLGEHTFHYALVAYRGDHLSAGVKRLSRAWRTPVPSLQGVWEGHTPGAPGLVRQSSLLTSVSAIKRHTERDTLIVRLYNISGSSVSETLEFGLPVSSAWLVSLMEERERELPSSGKRVELEMAPHEIVTLEVELDRTPSR